MPALLPGSRALDNVKVAAQAKIDAALIEFCNLLGVLHRLKILPSIVPPSLLSYRPLLLIVAPGLDTAGEQTRTRNLRARLRDEVATQRRTALQDPAAFRSPIAGLLRVS
jgi:hypothetical protein